MMMQTKIREYRAKFGLDQADLAARVNVRRRDNWKAGTRKI